VAPICGLECRYKIGAAHLRACVVACQKFKPEDRLPEDDLWPNYDPEYFYVIGTPDTPNIGIIVDTMRALAGVDVVVYTFKWFDKDHIVLQMAHSRIALLFAIEELTRRFDLVLNQRRLMYRIPGPDDAIPQVRQIPLYGPWVFVLDPCSKGKTGGFPDGFHSMLTEPGKVCEVVQETHKKASIRSSDEDDDNCKDID
jgi:hypothetical protein